MNPILERLKTSSFRRSFALNGKERAYLVRKGFACVENEAQEFIRTRLASAQPKKDGRQTPMKNHPAFIAQHATATCCRKCLKKWHRIAPGHALTISEIEYIVAIIMAWLHEAAK